MKVLHVLNDSVPLTSGYSTRSKNIITFQKELGIIPSVVTSIRQGHTPSEVEEIDGTLYYRTNSTSSISRLYGKKSILQIPVEIYLLSKRIGSTISVIRPDVIHSHSPILCAGPSLFEARKYGIPFVYEIRALWEDAAVDRGSTKADSFRYRLTRFLETNITRSADQIVVISEGLKSDLAERGIPENKIHVVRNGVDIDRFRPLDKDLELSSKIGLDGKTVIGYIGTFYSFEGIHYLIEALSRICSVNDNVHGIIIGHGEKAKAIEEQIKKTNLGKHVSLLGRIPHEEISPYYSLIDIFVYPRESKRITELVTPLKPLEAMAMEKVVLGSDVGGLKELISDGVNGFLFPKGDVKQLVEKLLWLIDNKNVRDGVRCNARKWVSERHDWRQLSSKYLDIYGAAINL
jgi:PEP-CTERM/exosortase A-associated glycosyltransferase